MDSKKRSRNLATPKKLEEFRDLQVEIKNDMFVLLERFHDSRYTKPRLEEELFKIYMKVK